MPYALKSGKSSDLLREDLATFAFSGTDAGRVDAKEFADVFAAHLEAKLGANATDVQHNAIADAATVVRAELERNNTPSMLNLASGVNSVVPHESLSAIAAGFAEDASPGLQHAAADIARANIVSETAQNLTMVRETQESPTGAEEVRVEARTLLAGKPVELLQDEGSHVSGDTGQMHVNHDNAGAEFKAADIVIHEAGHAHAYFDENHKQELMEAGGRLNLAESDMALLVTYDTRAGASDTFRDKPSHTESYVNLEENYADANVVTHALALEGKEAALAKLDAISDYREAAATTFIQARLESAEGSDLDRMPLREGHDTTAGLAYLREQIVNDTITPTSSPGELRDAMAEAAVIGYLTELKESRYADINPMTLSAEGLRAGLPEGLSRDDVLTKDVLGHISSSHSQLDVLQGEMTVFVPLPKEEVSSTGFNFGFPSESLGASSDVSPDRITVSPETGRNIRDEGRVSDAAGNDYAVMVLPRAIEEISVQVGGKTLTVEGGVGIYETPQGDYLKEHNIPQDRVLAMDTAKFDITPESETGRTANDAKGGTFGQSTNDAQGGLSENKAGQQESSSSSSAQRSTQSESQAQAEMSM